MKGVVTSPAPAGLIPNEDFPSLPARLNGKQGKKGTKAAALNAASSTGQQLKIATALASSDLGMEARVLAAGTIINGRKGSKGATASTSTAAASFSSDGVVGQKLKILGSNMEKKSGQQLNAGEMVLPVSPLKSQDVVGTAEGGNDVAGQKNGKLKMGSSKNNSGQQLKAQILGRNVDVGSGKTASTLKPQGEMKRKNWAGLFKDNRAPIQCTNLKQIQVDKAGICRLEEADVLPTTNAWGFTLVGYFAGKNPNKWSLNNLVKSWNVPVQHHFHPSHWIIFKFETESDMDKILDGGPYFAAQQPLVLKPVPSFFRFQDEEMKLLPVWISLPCLPKECWGEDAMSKIVSHVGKPIRMDKRTSTLDAMAYARALVQVDASKELIKEVTISVAKQGTFVQRIAYDYTPTFCTKCKCIGHSDLECIKEVVNEGTPKKRPFENMDREARVDNTPQNVGNVNDDVLVSDSDYDDSNDDDLNLEEYNVLDVNAKVDNTPMIVETNHNILFQNVNDEDLDSDSGEDDSNDSNLEKNRNEAKTVHVNVDVEDSASTYHVTKADGVSVMHYPVENALKPPVENEDEDGKGFQMVRNKKKEKQRKENDEAEESARIALRKAAKKEARQAAKQRKYLLEKRRRYLLKAYGTTNPIEKRF